MKQTLYSQHPHLQIGFHGCDKSIADAVLNGKEDLKASRNAYDWLGHGIYFWENNAERAMQWAIEQSKRPNSHIKNPAVIGAVLDLGYCFDLMDNKWLKELRKAYDTFVYLSRVTETEMPQNKPINGSNDILLRNLDCAVIMTAHKLNEVSDEKAFDSVRGVFGEGAELYPNAGFREKNHIQICVCNPNCIKGYFLPREANDRFLIP